MWLLPSNASSTRFPLFDRKAHSSSPSCKRFEPFRSEIGQLPIERGASGLFPFVYWRQTLSSLSPSLPTHFTSQLQIRLLRCQLLPLRPHQMKRVIMNTSRCKNLNRNNPIPASLPLPSLRDSNPFAKLLLLLLPLLLLLQSLPRLCQSPLLLLRVAVRSI